MKMNYVKKAGDIVKNYILRGVKIETFCEERLEELILRSISKVD